MVQLLLGLTLVVSVVSCSLAWPSELPAPYTFHAGTTETAITANFSKQDGDNRNFSRIVDNDNDSTASIVRDSAALMVRDSTASIEKGPTASMVRDSTASIVRDSTASIEKGPTASMVRDSTASVEREDQDLETIIGSQTQNNSDFEIRANQRRIQKKNSKGSSEITVSRAWRKMHPTEDLNYDLITPSSIDLSDSAPDAPSRRDEREVDELSEKKGTSINSQMIPKSQSPELANSKEFSPLLPSSASILPQEIKDVLDEPPDEIPTASVLSLQIETPLGRLRDDVRTSSYGFLQREITSVSSADQMPSTPSIDQAQFAESVDQVKSTSSIDQAQFAESVDQVKSTSSIDQAQFTESVDQVKSTSSIDQAQFAESVDQVKSTSSIDQAQFAESVDQVKSTSSIDQAQFTESVDQVKSTSSIDQAQFAESVDQVKSTSSIDQAQFAESVDQVKSTSSIDQAQFAESVDQVKSTSSIDQAQFAESVDQVKSTSSIDQAQFAESVDQVKSTSSIDQAQFAESVDQVKSTSSIDQAQFAESVDQVKSTSSIDQAQFAESVDQVKSTSSIDQAQFAESMDQVKSTSSIDQAQFAESVDQVKSTPSTDQAQFAESVDQVKSTPSADKAHSYLSNDQTQSAAEHSGPFPFPVTGTDETLLVQRNTEKRKEHLLMLKDSLKDDIFNSSSQRKALEKQEKGSKVSTLNPVLHLEAQMEEPNDFPQTTPLSVLNPSKERIMPTVVSSTKEENGLKYGKVIKMLSASELVAKQILADKAGLSLTSPTPEKPPDRALNASRDERTSLLASKEDGDDSMENWRMEDVNSSDLSLVTDENEKTAISSVSKGDAKMSKDGMQRSASHSAFAGPTDSSLDERDEMATPSSDKPEYRTSRGDVLVLNLSSVEVEQEKKLNPSKIPLLRSSIFLSAPREKEIATLTRDAVAERNIRKITSKSISSPSTVLRDETVGDDTRFSVLSNVGRTSQMFGDDSRMTRLADTMFRDDVRTPDVTSPAPTLKSEIVLTTKTAVLKPTQKSQIVKPRQATKLINAVSKGTNKTQLVVKKPAQQPTTKETTESAPKTVKASAPVKKTAPKVIVKKQPDGVTVPVKDYKGYKDKNKTTKSVTLVTSPTGPQKVNSSVTEMTPPQKKYESKKISAPESKCDGQSPPHVLIEKHGVYEVRVYPLSMWLSVNVITNNRILAELEAANKLQKYFNGDNEKGLEFNKSCPVLTQIKFQDYSDFKEKVNEYAVSFYVPIDGSTDMPAPNDSEVLVDTVEERTIYVYSFRARVWEMTDSFLQAEAKKLSASLRSQGEPFLSKYFYVASYATSRMSTNYVDYELWMYATRFRVHDVTKVKESLSDQPLNDVTRRTRSRVCKGFECPKFEVLALHKSGIQKRRYYGARFATYVPEFCEFTKSGIWKAFMPLHLYKHGVNSHFEVIGSTRPAGVVHVRETGGTDVLDNSSCSHTFTVSLYLPKRLHAAPPTAGPAAPRVKITELNDAIVYVQAVGGFLLVPERIQKEVDNFRQRLVEQNLCFRSDEYYLVVYDYITRFHGRLNEIWLIADRCPDSL